jgi:YesN/AraC family two-component response regulator
MEDLGLTEYNFIRRKILNPSIKKTLTTLVHALGDREDTNRLASIGQFYVLLSYLKQATGLMEIPLGETTSSSCVEHATRFIQQNYSIELDVQTICDYVNYSRSYLSRAFHQETGFTIPEYINKIRMENAMELLRETILPLREVATSVGIRDSFYFSKLFKKFTGQTPREYRLSTQSHR